ncbi:MAG: inositol monophosphatase family protein [Hoeflea sp.]|uniref:inositol monophosphatase family protein n=1 Tax=Hoeflea sp. TaxID=1940281 RepID=UPI001D3049F0|nr:inositol monophosphatase family protein [Hoeflea sp.]MBU4530402.1 inositol monophosphatase family protein [Alphaproteobacteria bacterium]MBU4545189.1 inositol monophosphatase family protein [Alphaproteobacteria bacterium]MBU4549611.1 inositol monophosphatase family protein [Alphaproteobacteria bacterium]MBV1721992.1 inositol monophosphatase family protein [Hoeflea sp.]MBV1761342.1 inositol monophosphatase family protein [Hoeflea sp.]
MTRLSSADIDWMAALLLEAGTTEIMPRFRNLGEGAVQEKTSAADLVTEADVAAERMITAALLDRFPGSLVIGEEAVSDNPALLDDWSKTDRRAFVVDPIDGTFNFASGVASFGVMLAVVEAGETVAGIIHDPVGQDWIMAEKGAGAVLRRLDGRESALRVAEPAGSIGAMIGSASWQYMPEPERSLVAANLAQCLGNVGYRCAAQEYRLLAGGHIHFALYNKLMPWDHLAGALITEEAGGHVRRFDGSLYTPAHLGGGLLATTDPESWAIVREALWRS